MPVFCEAHLVKYQIQNIVDTINPDFIIYNEGMFPSGPESTTQVSEKFKSEFTLDGNRGFDYEEMKEIIHENQKKTPVVIGHGLKDQIIPIASSENIYNELQSNNFNVSFIKFNGGHKININYLKKIQSIING